MQYIFDIKALRAWIDKQHESHHISDVVGTDGTGINVRHIEQMSQMPVKLPAGISPPHAANVAAIINNAPRHKTAFNEAISRTLQRVFGFFFINVGSTLTLLICLVAFTREPFYIRIMKHFPM
jgi:hypothetical protein